MSRFPEQLTTGPAEQQTTYELASDQVLIELEPDVDEEELSSFLAEQSFATASEPEYVQRARRTLDAAGLRWVSIPADDDADVSFSAAESTLAQRPGVARVRPVYFAAGGGPETAATPEFETLLVDIDQDREPEAVAALANLGLVRDAAFSAAVAPTHVFRVADEEAGAERIVEIAREAAGVVGVRAVEFDWLKLETFQLAPNDTQYANQWNMATIAAEGAWDVEIGDPDVWIAVIDSGFDLGHPDLNFTPNSAANPTHCNADDFIAGNPTPYDASSAGVFHGTACAGIAAATVDNNRGVAGVAGGCRIMPVRLGTVPTSARVAAGINWARQNGASVCSLSLTTTVTMATTNAVVNAWNAGLVLCAATGNGGGNNNSPAIGFPANHANTIAVGASDQNDQRKRPASADGECWGSQFGPEVDVVAPGVQIWTTDEQGGSGYNSNNGGAINWACVNYPSSGDAAGDYVAVFNGTSAATPHVAGLAALVMSANPSLTNQQVRDLIESTCDKVSPGLYAYANTPGRPNGTWHQEMGYGRINAESAVCAAAESVELTTPTVLFNDVPAGETVLRAATFSVRSCQAIDLQIVAGPTVTSGPPATAFNPFLGVTAVTVPPSPGADTAQLWFAFTGTSAGDTATGTMEIACPQTGQSWIVMLSANTIQAHSAAVMMVLDQSGSMTFDAGDGRQRIEVLHDSAGVLPGLLENDDAVGVVAFDHDAHDRLPLTGAGAGGKLAAIGTIGAHMPNPAGSTSIGDGVERAQTHLSGADPADYPTRAMVVLTDGRENAPQSIAAVSGSLDARVFAIGLGTPQQINPVALDDLTSGTGGYILMTGNLDSDEYFTLQKYYLQILAGVTNAAIVLDPDGFIQPGGGVSIPFTLGAVDYGVDVILLTPAPYAVRFRLRTPAGEIIEPAQAAALGGEFAQERRFSYYRFKLPVPLRRRAHVGRWEALLEVDKRGFARYLEQLTEAENEAELRLARAHGLRYSLNVHTRSNLHLRARLHQKEVLPGSLAVLEAALTEYGQPVAERADVVVEVVQPDGSLRKAQLAEVGPGRFRVEFVTQQPGVYRCRILAAGKTLSGRRFTREQLVTGSCYDPNRLPPDEEAPRDGESESCRVVTRRFVRVLLEHDEVGERLMQLLPEYGLEYEEVIHCLVSLTERHDRNGSRAVDLPRRTERIRRLGELEPVLPQRRVGADARTTLEELRRRFG